MNIPQIFYFFYDKAPDIQDPDKKSDKVLPDGADCQPSRSNAPVRSRQNLTRTLCISNQEGEAQAVAYSQGQKIIAHRLSLWPLPGFANLV